MHLHPGTQVRSGENGYLKQEVVRLYDKQNTRCSYIGPVRLSQNSFPAQSAEISPSGILIAGVGKAPRPRMEHIQMPD